MFISVSLAVTSLHATNSHFHFDMASSHAREHHLGQAKTLHLHLEDHHHSSGSFPEFAGKHSADDESVTLSWVAKHAQSFRELPFLPRIAYELGSPAQALIVYSHQEVHSHDPPLALPSAPRSPPA